MNGNYPGAGAGMGIDTQSTADVELSGGQKQALRHAVAAIVAETESYLPDGYHVGSELQDGGPTATVAVDPPAGHPVTAGYTPDIDDLDEVEAGLDDETQREVAQGLAASAVLQVMDAVGDGITPTAR
jgi:hypothetical protein